MKMNQPIIVLVVKGEGEPREPAGWELVDSRAPGSIGQIQERLSGLARPWMEAGGVPVVITENVLDVGLLHVTGYFFFLPSRYFYLIIRAGIKGTG